MAQAPISPEDLQEVVDALEKADGNQSQAARDIGIPRQTFVHRLEAARLAGCAPGGKPTEKTLQQRIVGYKDTIRELQGTIKSIQRDNLSAEVVRKHIVGLAEAEPDIPDWVVSTEHSDDMPGTPVTIWSDFHWGEVIDSAQINNINSYDMGIAQRRLRRLTEKTIQLCNREKNAGQMPGIVVCLGGDMVSGDIHAELVETNELPTMPVLLDLLGHLITALTHLASHFGRVFVPCAYGNHGRNTHKVRAKNSAYTNFDWLLYNLLEKHFENDDRIQFLVPEGTDAFFHVHGHRFLLTHGNMLGVRGGDGIIGALGPIIRGDVKTRRQADDIELPYDTLLMGHWHQFLPLPHVVVNGSLKGFDEFAKDFLRARPEPPRQALLMVVPDYGITEFKAVYCEPIKKSKARKEWVKWAA